MPFMVLEYINGKSLSDFVGDRRLTAHQACELLLPVVRALVRAHQAGIIHRDLKPSNILVSARGVVKVLDFGIAKFFTAEDPPSASARMNTARDFDTFESDGTADGAIVGTVPFMSPEQWGVDAIDARSDQWAIGVIFWRLVARVHPVGSLERSAIMQAVRDLEQPLRALDQVVSDCPPKFAAIVARCLAKRRADRYPDCEALLTELEGFLRGGRDGAVVGPYVGLDSFRETDAGRYFGRSAEVRTAVATLRDHPLLAVVGGSGAGKSSFVFAGVVPALRGERSLEVLSLRPGRRPLAALTAAVASVAPDLDEAKLITAPGRLGLALRHAAGDAKAWRVIVVDQFEELFTHEVGVDERRAFIAALLGAADDAHVPIRVIITLRSDYLEQVATDEALLVEVTRGLSFLPPLDREATREALVAPARDRGFDFEPGLADDMVRELEGTQVPLPLLQFAAACLWDRRDHDRHRLTRAAYEAIGGVVGAFAVHGDRVLAGLPPSSQAIARAIFVRLVSPERTRAVVDRDDLTGLAPAADVERVLAHLVAGRLIHVHTAPDVAATVELVHEALITEWPVLVRWLDESGAVAAFVHEVRNAARQWHGRGRPIGLLWSGAIARDAAAQARWAHGLLSAIEEDFLDQVAHHARREARRRRIAVASALVVLSAIAIVVVVALFRVRSAERLAVRRASQAETAERETARQLDVINQERAQRSAAERAADEAARAATAAEKVAEEAAQAQRQSTELSRAELAAANARLTAALATARAERDKADRMNDELQRYLRDERERVRKLQAERNKVIQKLD